MAVSVVFTVLAFGMAGLVLDLGQLRVDRRTNKSITDLAARAGVARLAFGPRSGVCKARQFLLANARGFSSFDNGSETWSVLATPPAIITDPCAAVALAADAVPCLPNTPSTWVKFQATAGSGRFTVQIQSGYALPDPLYAEDTGLADNGGAELGSCDNLAVILTERRAPSFAQADGDGKKTVRVRSVGRLNAAESLDFVAALQLLERYDCDVLVTGGNGTRIVAQPYNAYPGTIQIDSDATGTCPSQQKWVLNAQSALGGTVVACSAVSTTVGCRPGTGTRPSRVGIYAVNFKPAAEVTSPYSSNPLSPTSYGDTMAIPSPRTGRKYVDLRYRTNVAALDARAKGVLTGNGGRPPGCQAVVNNSCTANGLTWLVLETRSGNDSDCDATHLAPFFLVPGRTSAPNIWFGCDLDVATPLTLGAANSYIVVTGQLSVKSVFTISDPRKLYVGGRVDGNKIGLDLSSPTGALNVNNGLSPTCAGRTGAGYANEFVLGNGTYKVGSGFTVRMCQTFSLLASGFGKVPATDGTFPCKSACAAYTSTIEISSGSVADLSAPNEITGRLPDIIELTTTNPFEDLGLWAEAGGGTNGIAGGGVSNFRGVFFLPNAAPFTLTGGGASNIDLSAQFVAATMKVTGNATVNLVPNPDDSIPVTIYTTLLVR